jgi:hypothetical protein
MTGTNLVPQPENTSEKECQLHTKEESVLKEYEQKESKMAVGSCEVLIRMLLVIGVSRRE